MSAKHTPGPWQVVGAMIQTEGKDSERRTLAVTKPASAFGMGPEQEATARLIAAAPDMLAALEGLADQLPELDDPDAPLSGSEAVNVLSAYWPQIKAAIAKAKGGG